MLSRANSMLQMSASSSLKDSIGVTIVSHRYESVGRICMDYWPDRPT